MLGEQRVLRSSRKFLVYTLFFLSELGTVMSASTVSLTQPRATWEKGLGEELLRSDWPMNRSVDLPSLLIDVGGPSPLWVAPLPKTGLLNSVRRKKASREQVKKASKPEIRLALTGFSLLCACDRTSCLSSHLDFPSLMYHIP